MDPSTAEGWVAVANQRAADAAAMLPERDESAGPVYMAGYAVECALKGFLQHRGVPRAARGREGHDLRGLWKASGFRLADLDDADGTKSFYVLDWSTDLRYQDGVDTALKTTDLVAGARRLSGWVQARLRRQRRRRRK